MGRWRTLGGELSALGTLALSLPLGRLLPRERFDPAAQHPTPVVLVHGFLGDASNFLVLRSFLSSYGVRSFASFSYPPRLDHQRLAPRLGQMIERVCRETGSPRVDVVGHSLGGLVARYLVELGDGSRIGRLVTLGSPYYSDRRPSRELAILGAHDPLVPAPDVARDRVVIVEDCGHWNLLYHPAVLGAVTRFLVQTAEADWVRSDDRTYPSRYVCEPPLPGPDRVRRDGGLQQRRQGLSVSDRRAQQLRVGAWGLRHGGQRVRVGGGLGAALDAGVPAVGQLQRRGSGRLVSCRASRRGSSPDER